MRWIRTKCAISISDTKVLPMGAIGRVGCDIVVGHSVQASFGRGFGSLLIAESDIEDVPERELPWSTLDQKE